MTLTRNDLGNDFCTMFVATVVKLVKVCGNKDGTTQVERREEI